MSRVVSLLPTGTTSSAAPSIADETLGGKIPYCCDQVVICVQSTAGSGTMTATLRLWGYQPELDRWFDLGALNGGTAIPEVSTADTISYAEGVAGLRAFSRLYCEISSLGGASTAVKVDAVCIRAEPVTVS